MLPLIHVTFALGLGITNGPPNGYACQPNQTASHGLPFCDGEKSFAERTADLISRLTLQEKLLLLHAQPGTDGCAFLDAGVPRLDIPVYAWTEEANTGPDSACLAKERCSTSFPSPANLAAAFNRSLWHTKGVIISDEIRALNNAHGHRGCGPPAMIGINEWGPNINLIRDQRFGRNSELPSADPFLTGSYAVEYVKGLQEGPDSKYTKIAATLKHFTSYSVETDRGHDNANISAYDMSDSFLRQYEMGFVDGKASGVMCSCNLINGVPNCAPPALLNGKIRSEWGREDALVVSDCGVLGFTMGSPANWGPETAVSNTFNAGMDLDTSWT